MGKAYQCDKCQNLHAGSPAFESEITCQFHDLDIGFVLKIERMLGRGNQPQLCGQCLSATIKTLADGWLASLERGV